MNKKENAEISAVNAAGRKRRYKIGVISVVTTICVILAVIAFNYFVDYLAYRYVLEVDMTSNEMYEITQDTVDVLGTLKEPITVTVLTDETTYESNDTLNPIREVLKRYESLSGGKLTVEYINPTVNPQLYDRFDTLGDLSSGDIVVESARRFKHLSPSNLYELQTDSDSGNTYITGLRAEQRLTSAILYVTAEKVPQAAYIIGHQETTYLEQLDGLLTSGNYEVTELNLATTGSIDRNIDLLIVSQPLSDFSADEIAIIDEFLNNKGRMIVTYSAQTPYLERLERFFEEWGVRVTTDIVMDSTQCLAGYPTYIIPNVKPVEGLTENLNANSSLLIPGARAMKTLFEENEWRFTMPLLTSSSGAYTKSLSETITSYDQTSDDPTGEFPLAILAGQNVVDNLESNLSYILFLNAGMVSDSVLEQSNMLNTDYFVSALNYMSEDEDTVIIAPKDIVATTLTVTGTQTKVIFWLLVIIIPFGTLGLGIFVWVRRRHK